MNELIAKLGNLRSIKDNELELMLSWRNSPGVRANMYTRHEISLDEHFTWWRKIENRTDQKYYMYEYHDLPLGIVAFNEICPINLNSFWAFYASPDAPKGTGSRMEYLALTHAFEMLNLHKLSCEVLSFNAAVVKLHEKFGFKIEGVFREEHEKDGQFIDVIRLGLLKKEWDQRSNQMLGKLIAISK